MSQIRCPHCGQRYELTPEQVPQYAGQTITCTNCKQPFTVPREEGAGAGAGAPPPYPQQPQYQAPGAPPQYSGEGAIGYGGYQAPQQQTNGLAIASLVFGVIGIIIPIIPSIIGLILGIIGLNRTKDPRIGGKGLAIAGISVSVVSFFMAGCMLSILLPSLNRARETANRVKCASNLRQIGQGLLLYSNDHRGQYPPDLATLLVTQDISADAFVCPTSDHTVAPGGTVQQQAAVLPQHLSYVYIPGLSNAASADTVVAYEPTANHNGDGANFLFGDGHVAWESKQTAEAMIKSIEAGQNPPAVR